MAHIAIYIREALTKKKNVFFRALPELPLGQNDKNPSKTGPSVSVFRDFL